LNSHSINKASNKKSAAPNCRKDGQNWRKSEKKSRCFILTEPLQNHGSRVRILLPLPKTRKSMQRIGFFVFRCGLRYEEPHRILPKGKITVGLAPKLSKDLSQTIAQVEVLNPPRNFDIPIIPTLPTVPFGTASKKQQRPQSLVFCGRSFICLHRRNF